MVRSIYLSRMNRFSGAPSLHRWKIGNWVVSGSQQPRIGIWCGWLHPNYPGLGVLLVTDPVLRRRIHEDLCGTTPGLDKIFEGRGGKTAQSCRTTSVSNSALTIISPL